MVDFELIINYYFLNSKLFLSPLFDSKFLKLFENYYIYPNILRFASIVSLSLQLDYIFV